MELAGGADALAGWGSLEIHSERGIYEVPAEKDILVIFISSPNS